MTKLKICGFIDERNAAEVVALGIDYLGLNFFEGSKRFINKEAAKKIANSVRGDVKIVGLFVNTGLEEVNWVSKELSLDVVQLHGDESEDFLRAVEAPEVWKAVRIASTDDVKEAYSFCRIAGKVLLDAKVKNSFGGTGVRIDPQHLTEAKNLMPKAFIAGGVNPENASAIIKTHKPYGLDVASGVESSPGIKDLQKVKELLKCLRTDQS